MAPSQLFQGCVTTFRAHADVEVPDCFQKLRHGHTGKSLFEAQSTLNLTDYFQVTGFHTVIQKSIVTDLLETCRQHVQEVTADKFCMLQSNLTFWVSRLYPSGREGDFIFCQFKNPAVGDGNLVCIAAKILYGITKAVEGLLDIRTPVHFIKLIFKFLPVVRITELFAGG